MCELKMIGLLSSKIFLRHGIIGRGFCTSVKTYKFLRERQLRQESKLMRIKEIVLKENNETNGNIDWNQMVSELSEQKLVSKLNVEVDLMSAFVDNQIDKNFCKSLMKFVKSVPKVVNNSIAVSRYCYFISHFNEYIDETDIEFIRRTTDQLIAQYMANRLTGDVLNLSLIGLSKSSKDNCLHSIKLLEKIERNDSKTIGEIIESALSFRLINESLDLIQKYSEYKLLIIREKLISKIIMTFSEYNPSRNQTIKLLQILSENPIVFESDLKLQIIRIMESISYKTSFTSVGQNGICLKCDQTLSGVTAEEQNKLIKDFRSIVLNKENDLSLKLFSDYQKELKNFEAFMRKITSKQPLDLVVDGLNLGFSFNPLIVEDKKRLRKFIQKFPIESIDANVVKLLTQTDIEKYNNVLIVGRNHMKKWKQLNKFLVTQSHRISIFYAMNETPDDSYILYATLKNPKTYLISNDLYCDFSNKLSKKGFLFDRWLKTHQIMIKRNEKHLKFPDRFDHKIHISKDSKIIHIPFHSTQNSKLEWICFQS